MELFNNSFPTVLTLNLPSFTILALDSQVTHQLSFFVASQRYDKLIQLRPSVFLACFGACHLIDPIRSALLADLPQNPRFVGDLALYVQNTVNKVLGNARGEHGDGDGGENNDIHDVEFVLIGRCDLDSRSYVFNISKGPNSWMCFAKRNVETVSTAATPIPVRAVAIFLEGNVVDENMTEEEAIEFARKCMRFATMSSLTSGGKIQVVVVKPGSSVVHAWEQIDPTKCLSEYIYQGERRFEGY